MGKNNNLKPIKPNNHVVEALYLMGKNNISPWVKILNKVVEALYLMGKNNCDLINKL